jgi:acyl-CoA reductase-like NAD-dependent aldehyde dehydrogenase
MMDRFLKVQSPGGLEVFDKHIYRTGGIPVGLVPRGRNVGFIMPGNHPSTHFLWLSALAMKLPLVLRPSDGDVFTPYRPATALLAAGLPEDGLSFVPGAHDLVDAVVRSCSLSVLFGTQQLDDRYAAQRNVKVYGPGRSKVIVLSGEDTQKTADVICRMVMDDAGRGCVNASAVIVEADAGALASAVASTLKQIPSESPLTEGAQLGALRSQAEADAFSEMIDGGLSCGGREWTPGRSERVAICHGVSIMRPVVIEVPSFAHPLFGVELPFPFVIFARTRSRQETLAAARNSLVVAVPGGDKALTRDLLLEPTIDKVYSCGALSTDFDPREPHEGFLIDFLFENRRCGMEATVASRDSCPFLAGAGDLS